MKEPGAFISDPNLVQECPLNVFSSRVGEKNIELY